MRFNFTAFSLLQIFVLCAILTPVKEMHCQEGGSKEMQLSIDALQLLGIQKNNVLMSSLVSTTDDKGNTLLMLSLKNHGAKSFPLPDIKNSLLITVDGKSFDFKVLNDDRRQAMLMYGGTANYLVQIAPTKTESLRVVYRNEGFKSQIPPALDGTGDSVRKLDPSSKVEFHFPSLDFEIDDHADNQQTRGKR